MTADRNPFEVLGVSPCASRVEIERAAQRLLAEAALGVGAPGGTSTEHEVRRALDELRDPRRRLEAEVLSRALIPENIDPRDFREFAEALTAAANEPRSDEVATAEEMLWEAIEFPPKYELPRGHAERKRAAFEEPLGDRPPTFLSYREVDWSEALGLPPSTKKSGQR